MAHFARVDDENMVREIIVVSNKALENAIFPDSEPVGQAMLAESGFTGNWLQCSYSGTFRSYFPGVLWTYDPQIDAFIPPSVPDESAS